VREEIAAIQRFSALRGKLAPEKHLNKGRRARKGGGREEYGIFRELPERR